ncbi:MAG: glucose-6-phosphate isomerase [bacterium]|nr:glucose-6-phosphate isomerase [bacterium]MCP5070985.1 glucose-6-phosphate isomerase [bacterium]
MVTSAARQDIRLEVGGAVAPPLERSHGVTRAEIARTLPRLASVVPDLLGRDAASGFLRVLGRRRLLKGLQDEAARQRKRGFEDVVHIGIGGSSLGAEAIWRALAHPQHNLLPRRRRGGPRVHFVDNVDPESLGALLEWVDLKTALVHVVSKSGGTVETAAGFQIVRAALERRVGRGWARHCVATTGRDGALQRIARAEGMSILPFPEDVGGRFSGLTSSGLFTPAVAGVDVAGLVAGGRRMVRRMVDAPLTENPAAVAGAIAFLMAERKGKPIHVMMPYADALEPFARWFVQLSGESLGKRKGQRGVGPTPLPAKGTTDQHSQVQLFVEGPADKLVVFVTTRRDRRSVVVPGEGPASYLESVELGSLLRAEQQGTAVALARAGRPSLCWELPEITPAALGQLLVALETQTVYQAKLYGVNAYDQPGVEAGKIAAFALIGREGYEQERAAVEADQPERWTI